MSWQSISYIIHQGCQTPTPTSPTIIFFFFNATATTEIYTLSLHDALPISSAAFICGVFACSRRLATNLSDEIGRHTSELQSPCNIVCRLLLEKKKKKL